MYNPSATAAPRATQQPPVAPHADDGSAEPPLGTTPRRLSLSVQYAVDTAIYCPPPRRRVRALAQSALRAVGGDLTVRFVDRAESARLNKQYRRKSGATNVLAFAYRETDDDGALGDIIICCPVVEEEATRIGRRAADRYAHIIVHGVLHLLGEQHATAAAADRMEDKERRVLARFGIADPY